MLEIVTTIISIVTTSLSGYLVWWLQQNKSKKDYTQEALKILLKSELKKEYIELMQKGYVTFEELENVNEVYEAYHNLKGNGTGTKMIEEIRNLPLKED